MLCFIGSSELILISLIALLLFGGKKLPELMKGMGKGIRSFKEGISEPLHNDSEAKQTVDDNEEKK